MQQLNPESLPRRQTDPFWIQDYFLGTGHNETTRNATATFVKRKGSHYLVTCQHVLEAVAIPNTAPGAKHPTMALIIDRAVLNFSGFTPQGLMLSVRSSGPTREHRQTDIALARLDGSYWDLLSETKNKTAIDLDSWREPNWSDVRYCLVVGYPDESKKSVWNAVSGKVSTSLLNVVVELRTSVDCDTTELFMFSELSDSHDHTFSGMSGGAVYAIEGSEQCEVDDEKLVPVGIVYEGIPGTRESTERNGDSAAAGIFAEQDISFRALRLTPDSFDYWLEKIGI